MICSRAINRNELTIRNFHFLFSFSQWHLDKFHRRDNEIWWLSDKTKSLFSKNLINRNNQKCNMSSRRKFDKNVVMFSQRTSREILQWLLENASLNQKSKIRILQEIFRNNQTLSKQIVFSQKSRFICSVTFCQIFFSRSDNLFRHFKKTSNDAHTHIASIMKKQYCQLCLKRFRRSCDFWRHMRNVHSSIDLLFWKMSNKSSVKVPRLYLKLQNISESDDDLMNISRTNMKETLMSFANQSNEVLLLLQATAQTKIFDANIVQSCIYFDLYKNDF